MAECMICKIMLKINLPMVGPEPTNRRGHELGSALATRLPRAHKHTHIHTIEGFGIE